MEQRTYIIEIAVLSPKSLERDFKVILNKSNSGRAMTRRTAFRERL